MDFARKQLEKYGWKDGDGLGSTNQGITIAIKPHLKTGKEGMGYDLSHELTDTWYTKAYSDSLSRINVSIDDKGEELAVSLRQDEEDAVSNSNKAPSAGYTEDGIRPIEKMRRRMMKATFTPFSKGGTLSNGEMLEDSDSESSSNPGSATPPVIKVLNDEELLKACGGRTAHKAARFGLKLNGKLARIAAQEAMITNLLSNVKEVENSNSKKHKKSKKKRKHTETNEEEVLCDNVVEIELVESNENSVMDEKPSKKKKKSKRKTEDVEDCISITVNNDPTELKEVNEEQIPTEEKVKSKKKKKSKDKDRKDKNGL